MMKDHSTPSLFDGPTFEDSRDGDRLRAQLLRVQKAMGDGQWHTLTELAQLTHDPEASVSARLRDLRKEKFGGHVVERRYLDHGLWSYRLPPRS